MNVDGSGRKNLTASRADESNLAWSPDGRTIAFERVTRGNQDIFVVAASGRGLRNLTNTRRIFEEQRGWSPDGRKILLRSDEDISVMSPDGSNRINLTHDAIPELTPLWSPDGNRIAFGVVNEYSQDVYVMKSDGTTRRNLTRNRNRGIEDDPVAWSPDGGKIFFTRTPTGTGSPPSDIWVMNADGSRKVNLTPRPGEANDLYGDLSPDGKKIAFSRSLTGGDNYEIYVMNADGRRKTNVSRNPAYDVAPAWSPDGRKIAFGSRRGSLKNNEIVIVNARGARSRNATRSAAEEFNPEWSPEGGRIAFEMTRPQFCLVPDVVGLLLAGANVVLGRASCSPGRVTAEVSSEPKDQVLRQSARPGTRLPFWPRCISWSVVVRASSSASGN